MMDPWIRVVDLVTDVSRNYLPICSCFRRVGKPLDIKPRPDWGKEFDSSRIGIVGGGYVIIGTCWQH
jgi:hypothetical protein